MQIQSEIDKIKRDLPSDADDPVVSKMNTAGGNSDMALMVAIRGGDEATITSFIEETLKPRLKRNRGVGDISVFGNATRQIKVKLDPYRLQAYMEKFKQLIQLFQAER